MEQSPPCHGGTVDSYYIPETTITWKKVEELLQNAFRTKAVFGTNKQIVRIGVGEVFLFKIFGLDFSRNLASKRTHAIHL